MNNYSMHSNTRTQHWVWSIGMANYKAQLVELMGSTTPETQTDHFIPYACAWTKYM